MKGSIDCGNQTPGSSTITISGTTPTGEYKAWRLGPVVVECYFADGQVTVIGIASADNNTKVLLMVSLGSSGLNVEEAPGRSGQRYYASWPGAATLTSNGGHANGDVVEKNATPPPHAPRRRKRHLRHPDQKLTTASLDAIAHGLRYLVRRVRRDHRRHGTS